MIDSGTLYSISNVPAVCADDQVSWFMKVGLLRKFSIESASVSGAIKLLTAEALAGWSSTVVPMESIKVVIPTGRSTAVFGSFALAAPEERPELSVGSLPSLFGRENFCKSSKMFLASSVDGFPAVSVAGAGAPARYDVGGVLAIVLSEVCTIISPSLVLLLL